MNARTVSHSKYSCSFAASILYDSYLRTIAIQLISIPISTICISDTVKLLCIRILYKLHFFCTFLLMNFINHVTCKYTKSAVHTNSGQIRSLLSHIVAKTVVYSVCLFGLTPAIIIYKDFNTVIHS